MNVRHAPASDSVEGLDLIVRPNRTMSLRGLLLLFAGLTSVVLLIGIGFALAGAWPILPFAGLEIIVVGAVLFRLYRHLEDYEQIVIDRDRVTVIRRQGQSEWRDVFQRYWTQVRMQPRRGWYPSQLSVGSHGHYVVIAADVNEEERISLSQTLNRFLRARIEKSGRSRG